MIKRARKLVERLPPYYVKIFWILLVLLILYIIYTYITKIIRDMQNTYMDLDVKFKMRKEPKKCNS